MVVEREKGVCVGGGECRQVEERDGGGKKGGGGGGGSVDR